MIYQFKPDCFPDYKTYREWVSLAKVAKEVCCPCDDCLPAYESEMKEVGLCKRLWMESNLTIGSRSKVLTQGVLE